MSRKLYLEEIQKAMHLSSEAMSIAEQITAQYNQLQALISEYEQRTRSLGSLVPSLKPHHATQRASNIRKKLNGIDTVTLAIKARELREAIETDETL